MTKLLDSSARRSALHALREQARALDASSQDIDALLREMDRPGDSEENARTQADGLHLIIDDPVLGALRGSDGRRVDETAIQALLALGEPYASELSMVGQQVLASAPPPPAPRPRSPRRVREPTAVEDAGDADNHPSWRHVVGLVLIGCGFYELFVTFSPRGALWLIGQLLAFVTVIMPGLLLCLLPPRRGRAVYLAFTLLDLLAAPALLLLGGLSFFFAGGPSANEQISFFAQLMARIAGVRFLVGICLLIAWMTSREST